MNSIPDEILMHILNFLPFKIIVQKICTSKKFKNVILQTHWKTSKFRIKKNKSCDFLLKYKLTIEKLIIHNDQMINVKFDGLKYQKLVFVNINFLDIHEFTDIDSEISNECKKISFWNCCNYSKSLIDSLDCLKNCVIVEFYDCCKHIQIN